MLHLSRMEVFGSGIGDDIPTIMNDYLCYIVHSYRGLLLAPDYIIMFPTTLYIALLAPELPLFSLSSPD